MADGTAAYAAGSGVGRQINHTRKLAGGGGYVQASDLYTTANAARDVALLLRRLHTGQVDLYGDFDGTFFGQVFTARYASMLRSVTLDAAYPVSEKDPGIRTRSSRRGGRSGVACRAQRRLPRGGAGVVMGPDCATCANLRAYLVTGRTRDAYGQVITERVGIGELIELVNNVERITSLAGNLTRRPARCSTVTTSLAAAAGRGREL